MSGRKNTLNPPYRLFNAVSMGATATSSVVIVAYVDNIGIQLQWTGTPVGTFTFEVSLDYAVDGPTGAVSNAGTWIPLNISPAIAAAGVDDQAYVDINQTGATALRVKYTRSSGTGTLNGYLSAKQV